MGSLRQRVHYAAPSTHPAAGGCTRGQKPRAPLDSPGSRGLGRGAARARPPRGGHITPDEAHERTPVHGLPQALQERGAELEDAVKWLIPSGAMSLVGDITTEGLTFEPWGQGAGHAHDVQQVDAPRDAALLIGQEANVRERRNRDGQPAPQRPLVPAP
eukprot:6805843-Alexandrium_andersonii.AAC.1